MDKRFTDILARVYPNEKTRENYASRLRGLVRKVEADSLLDILEAPETWYPRIQEGYPSLTTRKNVLTAILVLFREDPTLAAQEETKRFWHKRHDELNRHQDARVKRSEPADKQIAQYTSYEEIEATYEKLKRSSPHKTSRASQQFLLLSILVHLRPKRADLGAVEVFDEKDPNRTDLNYIVLRKEGTSFLKMNVYKTSQHYRTVEEDIPEGLVRDIRQSFARWPRTYLFTKEDGSAMSNNVYSRFVMRTFEDLFGRSTGVSLLRHIYISEKLDFDDMTMEEQDEEARLMLHTSGLQRQYKWPKKTICPKLCGYVGSKGTRKKPRPSTRPPPAPQTRRKRRQGGSSP